MPGMTGMLPSCFTFTSAVTSGLGPGPAQDCGDLDSGAGQFKRKTHPCTNRKDGAPGARMGRR